MSEREEPDHGATAQSTTPGIVWYVLGVAFLAVVAWVGFEYLGWLVFGVFTYYVGRPIMSRLLRVVNSRSLAAALTLLFIIVPILLFIAAFLSVALGQALTFLSTDEVAAVLEELPFPSTDLPTDPIEIVIVVLQGPELSALLNEFGLVLGTFATVLFNVFLMLIFAFFLLVDDKRLAAWFVTNVLGPESPSTNYLRRVDRGLTSVYFGYTLTIFVVILLAAVIYTLFNVFAPPGVQIPAAILLAVVTGVFTLIPLVGRSIVYAFIVALLSIQAFDVDPTLLWIPLLFFALMVVVFDNVVRTYIRPYLSGKAYDMGLVMFAYLLGPVLFGWYGIFMGPLLMVLVVEFVVLILPRLAGVKPWRVSGSGETGLSGGILDHEPNSDQSTPSTDSGSGGAPSGDR